MGHGGRDIGFLHDSVDHRREETRRDDREQPPPDPVIALQRSCGNRAVAGLVEARRRSLQRRLIVGGHEYEQADLAAMTDVDERARDVLVRWAGTNVPHEFESLDAAIAAAMALGGGTRMQAEATVESATGDAPVSEKPVPEDEAAPMESDEEEPVAEPEKPATGRDGVKTSAEQRVEEAKKRRKGAARGRRGDAIRAARRRSSRHSRPPFESAISAVVNSLGPPTYTPSGVRGAGGRHSVAALGPIELTEWSRTASLPKALDKLKKAAPECGFVSGHLLNATFGGDGFNADNLTVLSRQGNANCRGFDDALKPAFVELRNAYRAMFNDGVDFASDPLRINIEVEVNTESSWFDEYKEYSRSPLFKCVFRHLTFRAWLDGAFPTERDFRSGASGAPYQAFHDAMYAVRAAIQKANEHGNVENPP